MSNIKMIAIKGGFYLFGEEIPHNQEGWLRFKNVSMSGGFSGGKGIPGVLRGDPSSTIKLDRFDDGSQNHTVDFPICNVLFVADCIDVYKAKTTTLR